MIIYKTCSGNYGFNDTVCQNLHQDEYQSEEKIVSDNVAQFNTYQSYLINLFPALMACYMGAWADIFGRKPFIFYVVVSYTIKSVINLLSAIYIDWPKYINLIAYGVYATSGKVIIFVRTLKNSNITWFTGGPVTWSMCTFAFISDVSEPDKRALRLGMAHVAQMAAGPFGPILGSTIFNIGGYVAVFTVELVINVISLIILYLMFRRFPWKQITEQERGICYLIDPKHVWNCIQVAVKKRVKPNRKLILLLVALFVVSVVIHKSESNVAYLYVGVRYGWEVQEYSLFQSITFGWRIITQMTLIPIVTSSRLVPESKILVAVISSSILVHLAMAFAKYSWLYYLGMTKVHPMLFFEWFLFCRSIYWLHGWILFDIDSSHVVNTYQRRWGGQGLRNYRNDWRLSPLGIHTSLCSPFQFDQPNISGGNFLGDGSFGSWMYNCSFGHRPNHGWQMHPRGRTCRCGRFFCGLSLVFECVTYFKFVINDVDVEKRRNRLLLHWQQQNVSLMQIMCFDERVL